MKRANMKYRLNRKLRKQHHKKRLNFLEAVRTYSGMPVGLGV